MCVGSLDVCMFRQRYLLLLTACLRARVCIMFERRLGRFLGHAMLFLSFLLLDE